MLDSPFMRDFLLTAKDTSFATLEGVSAAPGSLTRRSAPPRQAQADTHGRRRDTADQ